MFQFIQGKFFKYLNNFKFINFLVTFALGTLVVTEFSGCKIKSLDSEVNIIGGQPAESLFPNVVKIMLDPDVAALCTGVIVGPRTVLAASHCIKQAKNKQNYYNNPVVILPTPGQNDRYIHSTKVYTFSIALDARTITEDKVGLDFAILDFGEQSPFAHLPSFPRGSSFEDGERVTIVGFGATNLDGNDSGRKNYGYNKIAGHDSTVGYILVSGQKEANFDNALATKGDSGGPLLSSNGNYLYGITSAYRINGQKITNYFADISSRHAQTLLGYYKKTLEVQGYEVKNNELLFSVKAKTFSQLMAIEDQSNPDDLWQNERDPKKLETTCLLLGSFAFNKISGQSLASNLKNLITINWPFGGIKIGNNGPSSEGNVPPIAPPLESSSPTSTTPESTTPTSTTPTSTTPTSTTPTSTTPASTTPTSTTPASTTPTSTTPTSTTPTSTTPASPLPNPLKASSSIATPPEASVSVDGPTGVSVNQFTANPSTFVSVPYFRGAF